MAMAVVMGVAIMAADAKGEEEKVVRFVRAGIANLRAH